jgi:hypothetical protein
MAWAVLRAPGDCGGTARIQGQARARGEGNESAPRFANPGALTAAGHGYMVVVVYPRPVQRTRPAGITPCRALTYSASGRHFSVPARIVPYGSVSTAQVWQVAMMTTYFAQRYYAVTVEPTAPHFGTTKLTGPARSKSYESRKAYLRVGAGATGGSTYVDSSTRTASVCPVRRAVSEGRSPR